MLFRSESDIKRATEKQWTLHGQHNSVLLLHSPSDLKMLYFRHILFSSSLSLSHSRGKERHFAVHVDFTARSIVTWSWRKQPEYLCVCEGEREKDWSLAVACFLITIVPIHNSFMCFLCYCFSILQVHRRSLPIHR